MKTVRINADGEAKIIVLHVPDAGEDVSSRPAGMVVGLSATMLPAHAAIYMSVETAKNLRDALLDAFPRGDLVRYVVKAESVEAATS